VAADIRPSSYSADRRWASAIHSASGNGQSAGGTSSQSELARRMRSVVFSVRAAESTS
jgi:hypothetical protein